MTEISGAVEALRSGGTAVFPTETCYGIGCDATNTDAVEKVYELKRRSREKKLTCIVASVSMAERFCKLSEKERKLCEKFMPGPLTLVAEKKESLPDVVNTDFAFRVSSSEPCRKLSRGVDSPVVATSANISGKPSSYSLDEVDKSILEGVDSVVDGGRLERQRPSTIVRVSEGLEVLREGPVSKEELESFMEAVENE